MKLVVQLRLYPTPEQALALRTAAQAFNAAACDAARVGHAAKTASAFAIHKRSYRALRSDHKLPAQLAVRALAKAAEALARDLKTLPTFRPDGAMTVDQRNFGWKSNDRVSLPTLTGRVVVPWACGHRQRDFLALRKGQADVVCVRGKWLLLATCEVPEPPVRPAEVFLGADLGVVNLLTDSEGERHAGAEVERHRRRHLTARRTFQRKGTRSAKRRLKALSGKQARFQRGENHRISKRVVGKCKALGLGLALEDLQGIRTRVEPTVGTKHRRRLSNWGFFQLRQFLTYKARLAGVPVVLVDPRNTSRTCSRCGHCDKGNRASQDKFLCLGCGHSAHADQNAATNVAARAASKPASSVAALTG